MLREMPKLPQHDLFHAPEGVLAFTEDLGDRSLTGEALVLLVQAKLRAKHPDQVFGVAPVQDREAGLQPDRSSVASQEHVGNRVKGPARHTLTPRPDQEAHPLQHLLRRLAREGQ